MTKDDYAEKCAAMLHAAMSGDPAEQISEEFEVSAEAAAGIVRHASDILERRSHSDAIANAKRLARHGYGWHDIVVRCEHRLSSQTAKQLVLEAEYARLAQTQEAQP